MTNDYHLSDTDREKLKKMLQDNPELSDTYIAAQFNVSQTCVWRHRNKLGLENARYYLNKRIEEAWKENPDATTVYIAEICNTHPSRAWYIRETMQD